MFDQNTNVWRSAEISSWARRIARRVRGGMMPRMLETYSVDDSRGIESLKDAHWQLAENVTRFRELLDGQEDLIVRRDADHRILFANRAYCEAFAVSTSEIYGRRFCPAAREKDAGTSDCTAPQNAAELFETSQGMRWILWDQHRLLAPPAISEILSVGRDVTAERRAALERREARDQAQSANRAKSRFLAAMSHEIRTPMNGILGMASLLNETEQTEEQQVYTRAVESSARALLALIDEILDFSKIEAGKLRLSEQPFSLRACIAGALELLAPRAAEKNIALVSSISADVPELVAGDQSRVRQIVLNLVSNAVNFTNSGGVEVCVRRRLDVPQTADTSLFEIEVKDTGIGFSDATMKTLFEEFEQADNPSGGHRNGTGLGLAISIRLARAMGGDIRAESALGGGAKFTAILRFADAAKGLGRGGADAASLKQPASNGQVEGRHPPRVLIAEDNDINALMTRRVSERAGCSVTVVKTGKAAVDTVVAQLAGSEPPFDLILMDVFMPEMDGLQATKEIKRLFGTSGRALNACPPIVALTANAYHEDRERCMSAGMNDYLAKPFDSRQLMGLLARWVPRLDRRRAGSRNSSNIRQG